MRKSTQIWFTTASGVALHALYSCARKHARHGLVHISRPSLNDLCMPRVQIVHCEGMSPCLKLLHDRNYLLQFESCLLCVEYQEQHKQDIRPEHVDRPLSCPCLRSQVQQHAQSLAYVRGTCGNTPEDQQTTLEHFVE